eukprot:TRINITY_DN1767_c0_g1_i1.p3 TRINITY_DN1767_c0_g1~~TRINITY_DN1767_c0_g1_i1.p3  ORF type:complete len:235 (-),score=45.22 TRINITY_DN1767_c0_g1_i1:243-947(-)
MRTITVVLMLLVVHGTAEYDGAKKVDTIIIADSTADAELLGQTITPADADSTSKVDDTEHLAKAESISEGAAARYQDPAALDFAGSVTTQEKIGDNVISKNYGGYKLFQKSSGKVDGSAKSKATMDKDTDRTNNRIHTKVLGRKSALDLEAGGISKNADEVAHNSASFKSSAPKQKVDLETETKLEPEGTISTVSLFSKVLPNYHPHPQLDPFPYTMDPYPYSYPYPHVRPFWG